MALLVAKYEEINKNYLRKDYQRQILAYHGRDVNRELLK